MAAVAYLLDWLEDTAQFTHLQHEVTLQALKPTAARACAHPRVTGLQTKVSLLYFGTFEEFGQVNEFGQQDPEHSKEETLGLKTEMQSCITCIAGRGSRHVADAPVRLEPLRAQHALHQQSSCHQLLLSTAQHSQHN